MSKALVTRFVREWYSFALRNTGTLECFRSAGDRQPMTCDFACCWKLPAFAMQNAARWLSAIVLAFMSNENRGRDPYLVKSVVHSSRILSAFRSAGEALPLREVAQRSGLPKTMSFRLLYTLEKCGMVEKVGANLYQSTVRPVKQRLWRLGYAAQGTDYRFSREVSASLERAAKQEGIELIAVDNRYSAKIAQRNADLLVREKVDLAIEFQTDETIAPIVAAKYRNAGIPMIAIDIPHPGATYYGANNYEAGLIGGKYLGRWVKEHWHSELDEIILLELPRAGNLPQMRLTGVLVGINLSLPSAKNCRITHLNGNGELGPSFEVVRRHLRQLRSRRIVVGAINDVSAIGALRAFEEAGVPWLSSRSATAPTSSE